MGGHLCLGGLMNFAGEKSGYRHYVGMVKFYVSKDLTTRNQYIR